MTQKTNETGDVKSRRKVNGNSDVQNTKLHDNSAKIIFEDPILCAQFLRGGAT